ncbi:MAG: hypothetical protein R2801_04295 [Chitinophagales bacterium]
MEKDTNNYLKTQTGQDVKKLSVCFVLAEIKQIIFKDIIHFLIIAATLNKFSNKLKNSNHIKQFQQLYLEGLAIDKNIKVKALEKYY